MSLFDVLNEDIKTAMRSGDKSRLEVLRMLKSSIHNELIARKKQENDDELFLFILQREIKKRKEAIESFTQGKRKDLADKESVELKVLQTYQPIQLSTLELKKIIEQIVQELNSDNFGKIMKTVMEKVKGKADGKEVSNLVKQILIK